MAWNNEKPGAVCADKLKDLAKLAETGEAPEGLVAHCAGCPACRAAAKESFERRQEALDKMESVIDDIDGQTPPTRGEVIAGRVTWAVIGAMFLASGLLLASAVIGRQAAGRDWRLARSVEARIKPVAADPIGRCHADHRLLCEMVGDQDSCTVHKWYGWVPYPAPTKVVCFVDTYYSLHHPDRPTFYVIDGDQAVGYLRCGEGS